MSRYNWEVLTRTRKVLNANISCQCFAPLIMSTASIKTDRIKIKVKNDVSSIQLRLFYACIKKCGYPITTYIRKDSMFLYVDFNKIINKVHFVHTLQFCAAALEEEQKQTIINFYDMYHTAENKSKPAELFSIIQDAYLSNLRLNSNHTPMGWDDYRYSNNNKTNEKITLKEYYRRAKTYQNTKYERKNLYKPASAIFIKDF